MKRLYILFTIIFAVSCLQSNATPRTESQAQKVAKEFFAARSGLDISQINLQEFEGSILRKSADREHSSSLIPYYIFNKKGEGFVIISGSDITAPVLAYSDHNTFSDKNIPENLNSWFSLVADAIKYVEEHPETAITTAHRAALNTKEIAPLLGNIKWDQGSPYNDLCPTNSMVGCAATAMAQVMRFHKYPAKGIGSHYYTWRNPTTGSTETLSVDFSQQTYNWDLMFQEYNKLTTSSDSKAEVAKICYHAGVSLDMNYSPSGSGSFSHLYKRALTQNFGYNPNIQNLRREGFHFDEWNSIIHNELINRRPVLHGGQSDAGGHAYVIDGYKDGLYHVNWGWSGSYDGYYDICLLRPEGAGSGAGVSTNGFSIDQSITINITPQQNVGKYYTALVAGTLSSSTKSAKRSARISLTSTKIKNYATDKFSGIWGYLLMQDDKEIHKANIRSFDISAASGGSISIITSLTGYLQIPSTIPNGNYRLYTFVQENGSTQYDILRHHIESVSYLNVELTDDMITISKDDTTPILSASNWSSETETYSGGIEGTLSVDITNQGTMTHVGAFYLNCSSESGETYKVKTHAPITIAPGATQTVMFQPTFPTGGTWTAKLTTTLQNADYYQNGSYVEVVYDLGITTTIRVEEDASAGGSFTLTAVPTISADSPCSLNSYITFSLPVKNSGSDYKGQFSMRFYSSSNLSSSSYVGEIVQTVEFTGNGTTGTISIRGLLSSDFLEANKKYYTAAYYRKGTKYLKLTGAANRVTVNVTKENPNSIDNIDAENTMVEIYDIVGRKIGRVEQKEKPAEYNLPTGIYIIGNKKIFIR